MKRWHLAGVLTAALLAAGCGGSGAGSTQARLTNESQSIVLGQRDVGPSYQLIAPDTKPKSLRSELQDESARAQAADRRSWLGGYMATYARPGSMVISIAANYRNASDAGISVSDPVGLSTFKREFDAHAVTAPSQAPGQNGWMGVGTTKIEGRRYDVRMYLWQHSRAIGAVLVVGDGDSTANVLRLARKEDMHMSNLIAAGLV